MDGEIILTTLKLIKVSFLEYCDYNINTIAILSFLFGIFSAIFNISDFIKSNLYFSLMILICLLTILVIHYFYWYKHNFNKVTIDKKALIIIEGQDDKHLSMEISKLIVPCENLLILTLMITFGEFITQELLNKSYTLLIKKPEDLEIKFMNNVKSNPFIIDDGFNSSFYCINLKYKNNTIDNLLFELQADKTTNGCFSIYFLNENNIQRSYEKNKNLNEYFEKISSKKSPLHEEKIYCENVEINKGNTITINKNEY